MDNKKVDKLDLDMINFGLLWSSFLRRKNLYLRIIGSFLIASSIYAFSTKKTWVGEFNIVIADKNSLSSGLDKLKSIGIGRKLNLNASKIDVDTQLAILRSPSVLEPVYNYVKKKLENEGVDISAYFYKLWLKDNLKIGLEKDTSVLKIEYKDTDKDFILPVLEKIVDEYKSYSVLERKQDISKGLVYLNEQILKYREKSKSSLRKAEEYALNEDLIMFMDKGTNSNIQSLQNSQFFNPSIVQSRNESLNLDFEFMSVSLSNRIRFLEKLIFKLESLKDDSNAFLYAGFTVPELQTLKIYKELKELDEKISIQKSKFKENDVSIKILNLQRDVLMKILKEQTFQYLNALLEDAKEKKSASERKKEVIIKYRELMREANRDKSFLVNLEKEEQELALEKAKLEDPWDLISKPTINPYPIWPNKKLILFLSGFIGLITSQIIAYLLDKKTNIIFDIREIFTSLEGQKVLNLYSIESEFWSSYLELFKKDILIKQNTAKIVMVTVGDFPKEYTEKLKKKLEEIFVKNFYIVDDISESNPDDYKFVFIKQDLIKRYQLNNFLQKIKFFDIQVNKYIVV
nr:hypothetical protein [Prochlorococcus marinus]